MGGRSPLLRRLGSPRPRRTGARLRSPPAPALGSGARPPHRPARWGRAGRRCPGEARRPRAGAGALQTPACGATALTRSLGAAPERAGALVRPCRAPRWLGLHPRTTLPPWSSSLFPPQLHQSFPLGHDNGCFIEGHVDHGDTAGDAISLAQRRPFIPFTLHHSSP